MSDNSTVLGGLSGYKGLTPEVFRSRLYRGVLGAISVGSDPAQVMSDLAFVAVMSAPTLVGVPTVDESSDFESSDFEYERDEARDDRDRMLEFLTGQGLLDEFTLWCHEEGYDV